MYLYLKQKVFTIGDKFTFFDEVQNPVYHVKGSIFRIPQMFTLIDASGGEIMLLKRKFWSFLPAYSIQSLDGKELGTVKKKFSFHQNFDIVINGKVLTINGSLFGYKYEVLNENGEVIMGVSKKYISWGDTYEVFINESQIQPEVAACICVAFDSAVHGSGRSN